MSSTINVPFFDLKRQYAGIKDAIGQEIQGVLDSMIVTNGPVVAAFEEAFAKYCDAGHCAAVNTGSSALHLAMRALDITEGDEVIVQANTFIASPWGASYVNATPVFVDCYPNTWEIDIEAVERAITPKTKAVIGVHLYGQPCDAIRLRELCDKHGLYFVEDAAQGHGSTIHGRTVGSIGHIACFSFYPGKNLGTYGEGGAVVSNDKNLVDRVKRLRNLGSAKKYYHEELGYNMRMGAIQGAVLKVKLEHLNDWNASRYAIAQRYLTEIKNPAIKHQDQPEGVISVFHLYVITTENREHFKAHMSENGVGTAMHYPVPCHLQECYKELNHKEGDFEHSEYLASHCVSLPMFPEMTEEEVNRVIEVVNAYVPASETVAS